MSDENVTPTDDEGESVEVLGGNGADPDSIDWSQPNRQAVGVGPTDASGEEPPEPPAAATGATAGSPGGWTPAGSTVPAGVAELQGGSVVADPATPWTAGQYVQTQTAGAPGEATWTGSGWVGGRAPADEPEPDPEPPDDEGT